MADQIRSIAVAFLVIGMQNCHLLNKIFQQRIFRFLLGGGVATVFNILLIYIMIELIGFNTPILRNLANVLSIELSLLFSFFIYQTWVWPGGSWTVREIFYRRIPLYHGSTGATIITRSLILFPILDWLGVHYIINTLVGIALGASLNYVINDRIVFRNRQAQPFSAKVE